MTVEMPFNSNVQELSQDRNIDEILRVMFPSIKAQVNNPECLMKDFLNGLLLQHLHTRRL